MFSHAMGNSYPLHDTKPMMIKRFIGMFSLLVLLNTPNMPLIQYYTYMYTVHIDMGKPLWILR